MKLRASFKNKKGSGEKSGGEQRAALSYTFGALCPRKVEIATRGSDVR